MRIAMMHPAHNGRANVLPEDQAIWEAAGWRVVPQDPETQDDKDDE